MRVLYIGVNRFYANPNRSLFQLLFSSAVDTECYGPGYSSPDELDRGLPAFLVEKSNFDFVVTDADTLFWSEFGNTPLKTSYLTFDPKYMESFHRDVMKYLRSETPPVLLYMNIDYYHITEQVIDVLREIDPYLIARDAAFWSPISEMEELKHERFYDHANDNWFKYIVTVPTKIVSLPGVISESEFNFEPLHTRKFDVSVPGVKYHQRRVALDKLSKLGVIQKNGELRRKILSRAVRYSGSKMMQKIYRETFVDEIERSKFCFTCGSALGYPLRKFLEIPASGGLLFCSPFKGFKEFGFEPNKNVISLDSSEIGDQIQYYLKHLDISQKIARNGQNMILQNHSFGPRTIQLRQTLEKISSGAFRGSKWKGGQYVFQ